ncbi:MAG: type II secretion system protein GspG, partial [Planctomycetes bacterium]|nr:type II secretion system protein GspG [Planctomycetota bacterium]
LFWPVLMLLVGAAGIFLGALTGGGGLADASGIVIEGGAEGFRYYAWLLTARNPLLLGGIAGALLAVGGLYLYVEGFVKPKEEAARQQLARLADKLRVHGEEAGRLPDSSGAPLHKAFKLSPGDTWRGEDLLDPWGQPVLYECQTDIFGQEFRLLSTGWNGRSEDGDGDDLSAKGSLSGPGPAVRGLLDSIGKKIFGEDEEEKK